jgi:hypothetical protein
MTETPPTEDNDPDLRAMRAPRVPGTLDYIGLGGVLLPFAVSFRTSSSSSVTTTVTGADGQSHTTTSGSAKFSDPVAMVGGGLGLVIGLVTLTQITRVEKAKRGLRIGLTLGLVALGALQLLVRSGLLSG